MFKNASFFNFTTILKKVSQERSILELINCLEVQPRSGENFVANMHCKGVQPRSGEIISPLRGFMFVSNRFLQRFRHDVAF